MVDNDQGFRATLRSSPIGFQFISLVIAAGYLAASAPGCGQRTVVPTVSGGSDEKGSAPTDTAHLKRKLSTDWPSVLSADGKLRLGLRNRVVKDDATSKEWELASGTQVIAELTNVSEEPMTIVIPFRDMYRDEALQIELRSDKDRCRYTGPDVSYALNPGAFCTLQPKQMVWGYLHIFPANYEGITKAGFYQLWYTYAPDQRHVRLAGEYGLPPLWTGQIRCGPVELQRLADAPEDGPPDCEIEKYVTIDVPEGGYRYTLAEAAAGVKLEYKLTVRAELSGVIRNEVICNGLGPDPSGLCTFEEISGHGQSFSILDVGHGPPPSREPVTIRKGQYSYAVDWRGKNWKGPSDTAMPEGPPFPAGKYWFRVSISGHVQTPRGERPYQIVGIAPVILAP